MPADMSALLADLAAESAVITEMLSGLSPEDYELPTPAQGWAIRDQVSHLAYFDEMEVLAATDPERFRAEAAELMEVGDSFPDEVARRYAKMPAEELSGWFGSARARLIDTFADIDARARLPWFGPEMSAASAITARLMETWAHGQDIADTIGFVREPTDRLRHIAHLGVSTFTFAHRLRGLEAPSDAVRVELTSPGGEIWSWGPEGASDQVTGSALEFCLVVTQRRNLADTGLVVRGPVARRWMGIAQAYAGGPGPGREAGSFPRRER